MNEVKLTARLGRDPELRYTASGQAVANLSVAHKYKDNTSWFTVVAWADVAKNTTENIKKGDLVEIVGRLSAREWTAKDGSKRTSVEIVADSITPHYKKTDLNPKDVYDQQQLDAQKTIEREDHIPF